MSSLPHAAGLALADDGTFVVVSNFSNSDFLAPAFALRPVSAGGLDVSVGALLEDGSELWSRSIGGSRDDVALAVHVDAQLAVTVAGITRSNPATIRADDTVLATIPISTSGSGNHPGIFIARFDLEGRVEWAHRLEFGSLSIEPVDRILLGRVLGRTRLLAPIGTGVHLYFDLDRETSLSSTGAIALAEFGSDDALSYAHLVAGVVGEGIASRLVTTGANLIPADGTSIGVAAHLGTSGESSHRFGVARPQTLQTEKSSAFMLLNSRDALQCVDPFDLDP